MITKSQMSKALREAAKDAAWKAGDVAAKVYVGAIIVVAITLSMHPRYRRYTDKQPE